MNFYSWTKLVYNLGSLYFPPPQVSGLGTIYSKHASFTDTASDMVVMGDAKVMLDMGLGFRIRNVLK
jgi:hypothetical protein